MSNADTQFEIVKNVSTNNINTIYKVRRLRDSAVFILKTPRSTRPEVNERARYRREYKRLKELEQSQTNVIRAIDYLIYKGRPALLLEYFDGENLGIAAEKCRFSAQDIINIAIDITHTLKTIHASGILHKDINPSNILYQANNASIKLIDFGLSSRISTSEPEMDTQNQFEGTIAFISPEQTGRMNRPIDYRTDFYSLGATIYYLITGQAPFVADDIQQVIHAHLARMPVPPAQFSDGTQEIPDMLSAVIMKLLEKAPEQRYQSADGLLTDLELCRKNTAADFVPGRYDHSPNFRLIDGLFGREEEKTDLFTAYDRAAEKGRHVALVQGDAGIGKTALIQSLQEPIIGNRGLFLQGKFDQFTGGEPYAGLFRAFGGLVRKILSQDENILAKWRELFLQHLRGTGSVLTEAIPDFEQIIGPQDPTPDLDLRALENRFYTALSGFLKAVEHSTNSVVLFLDDMQWSDLATVQFVEKILAREDLKNFLIVLSFRPREVDNQHALQRLLAGAVHSPDFTSITVSALDSSTVTRWLAESCNTSEASVEEPSEALHVKTGGNPFFIKQIINSLTRKNCIVFNGKQRRWEITSELIESLEFTDNVVELLIEGFRELSQETMQVLTYASLIGSTFSRSQLQLFPLEPATTHTAMADILAEGYAVPVTTNYMLLDQSEDSGGDSPESNVVLKFKHDRIRQAAYSLLPATEKPGLHYTAVKNLLHDPRQDLASALLHLNECYSIISDPLEQKHAVNVFRIGAQKAQRASAYSQAYTYLLQARQLDPNDEQLLEEFASAAYLDNHESEGEQAWQLLLSKAQDSVRKAEIIERQMGFETYFGRLESALDFGIQALQHLGIHFSKNMGTPVILKEFLLTQLLMRGKKTEDILAMPETDDRKIKLILSIFSNFVVPAFISGNQGLFAVAALRGVRLTLKHGLAIPSAIAFANYAILLTGMGKHKTAHEMAVLGMKLNHRYEDMQWRAFIYTIYSLFTIGWVKPWKDFPPHARKTIDVGLQTGDLFMMAHNCAYLNLWNPDITIQEALEEGNILLPGIRQQEGGWTCAKLAQLRWRSMAGELPDNTQLTDEQMDEQLLPQHLREIQYLSGLAIYYSYKIQVLYHYGWYQEAVDYSAVGDTIIHTLTGSAYMEEYCLYSFLAYAAIANTQSGRKRRQSLRRMRTELRRMKHWATVNPHNFLALYTIMQAELSRVHGKNSRAEALYRNAVDINQGGGMRHTGLLYELCGSFFHSRGDRRFESYFLQESYNAYARWGAYGKLSYLEQKYGTLVSQNADAAIQTTFHAKTYQTGASDGSEQPSGDLNTLLDFHSLIKASQAISKETDRDALMHAVMSIVVENTGAHNGYLLIKRGDNLFKTVEGSVDHGFEVRNDPDPFPLSEVNEASTLQYVIRTQQPVILDDSSRQEDLTGSKTGISGQSSSVLCAPVVHNAELKGIWYLENPGVTGAFNSQRLEVLNILSPQVAISLTNTEVFRELDMLNATLEHKVEERTALLQTQNRQIIESITYASRIQKALLPPEQLEPPLHDSFVIWKPRDIVGGDFFWFTSSENGCRLVLGDCTGHGVPGAFMTMNVIALLNQTSPWIGIGQPETVIRDLNRKLRRLLGQDSGRSRSDDGLDIAIIDVPKDLDSFCFAGAKMNLYVQSAHGIQTIRGDKQSVGYYHSRENYNYQRHTLKRNSDVYICSDGYVDQCGGKKGFPFGYRRLRELLNTLQGLPVQEQKTRILQAFSDYKQNYEQVDDLLFWGGRIP